MVVFWSYFSSTWRWQGSAGLSEASRVIQAPVNLTRYAWLSVATSLVTLTLKTWAYLATNSVGLMSDALESIINLLAACLALAMLWIAQSPADDEHAFGHEKAEYFSSGAEGALILVAAVSIMGAALSRFYHPVPLSDLGLGSLLSLLATTLNGVVAVILIRAGKLHRSVTLEADGHHLLTDVWTSLALLVGIGCIWLTGKTILDPIVACIAAVFIGFTGYGLARRSVQGLTDASLSPPELQQIEQALAYLQAQGVAYHALRTRRAGRAAFVQLHVLVPGEWDVRRGHNLLEQIESAIVEAIPGARVLTHLEPIEDPVSFEDLELDRPI